MTDNIPTDTLAETESYIVWVSQEPDGETSYHMDIGNVTLHFFEEEWEEFHSLISQLPKPEKSVAPKKSGKK
jgi:hypothetical protein